MANTRVRWLPYYPAWAISPGYSGHAYRTQRWLMRRFDVVSTISHRMHQRLLDKGVAPARAMVAPNWVDIDAISPSAFAALAPVWGEAPVVNHFRALLAEAAPRFTHASTIQFVFCGNGAGREQLVAQCAGLANVHFMDLQPLHLLSELLGTAKASFLELHEGVNEGVNALQSLISTQPGLRAPTLAQTLNTSTKTIERWLKQLKAQGLVEFRGATKTGGYHATAPKEGTQP